MKKSSHNEPSLLILPVLAAMAVVIALIVAAAPAYGQSAAAADLSSRSAPRPSPSPESDGPESDGPESDGPETDEFTPLWNASFGAGWGSYSAWDSSTDSGVEGAGWMLRLTRHTTHSRLHFSFGFFHTMGCLSTSRDCAGLGRVTTMIGAKSGFDWGFFEPRGRPHDRVLRSRFRRHAAHRRFGRRPRSAVDADAKGGRRSLCAGVVQHRHRRIQHLVDLEARASLARFRRAPWAAGNASSITRRTVSASSLTILETIRKIPGQLNQWGLKSGASSGRSSPYSTHLGTAGREPSVAAQLI